MCGAGTARLARSFCVEGSRRHPVSRSCALHPVARSVASVSCSHAAPPTAGFRGCALRSGFHAAPCGVLPHPGAACCRRPAALIGLCASRLRTFLPRPFRLHCLFRLAAFSAARHGVLRRRPSPLLPPVVFPGPGFLHRPCRSLFRRMAPFASRHAFSLPLCSAVLFPASGTSPPAEKGRSQRTPGMGGRRAQQSPACRTGAEKRCRPGQKRPAAPLPVLSTGTKRPPSPERRRPAPERKAGSGPQKRRAARPCILR